MLLLGLLEVPWWVLLGVILAIAFYLHEIRDFDYFKKQGIPTLTPRILIGTLADTGKKGMGQADLDAYQKFKGNKVFGEFYGPTPHMVVCDESMLSEIFVKDFATFQNRWAICEKTSASVEGLMLFNLDDAQWKRVRNEISPTFTAGKLKKMVVQMNNCAKSLVDHMCEEGQDGKELDIKGFTGAYSMDVIALTAFGVKVDSQKDKNNPFVTHARRAFDLSRPRLGILVRIYFPKIANLLNYFGIGLPIFPNDAFEFFHKITKDAMEVRKLEEDKSRVDFLQLMIKARRGEDIQDHDGENVDSTGPKDLKGLTEDEILTNAAMFFAAGYDTTGTSLSFLLYNLATNPDCQEKLMEEIDSVVGDKDIDYNLLQQLPYLDMCLNENHRLYPSAYRLNRVAKKDVTINGIFIRKGMVVQIPFFSMQRDPEKWPEPERFDPERFSPQNKKDRNPYHFLTFGYGPRNCIGMRLALQSLKIAVICLLQRVTIQPCEKTKIPMVLGKQPTVKPESDIWLKIEKRKTD